MACHYRLAGPTAQVGQPEVKLGLIPGAGGTQRLPRLAGIAKAAEMCATGNPVGAAEAQKFGIVDRVVEGDLLAEAVEFARALSGPPRRTRDLTMMAMPTAPILRCRPTEGPAPAGPAKSGRSHRGRRPVAVRRRAADSKPSCFRNACCPTNRRR